MNKTNGFASIYRELKEYPSEAVTEVIEGFKAHGRAFTVAQVKEVLDRRVAIAARFQFEARETDPETFIRALASVPQPSREGDLNAIKERIARKCQRLRERKVTDREWNVIVYKIKQKLGPGPYPTKPWWEN